MPICPHCGAENAGYILTDADTPYCQLDLYLVEVSCANDDCGKVITVLQDPLHLAEKAKK